MKGLPGILGVVAEIAGAPAAERLALARGGTEMKISGRKDGPLARLIGVEAAEALVDQLGPVKVTIPMAHLRGEGARRAAVAKMIAEGKTAAQAALAADVHERTARRVREAAARGPGPLFDRKD